MGPVACDYAEMFQTSDGRKIDVGYFVTFDGESDKIRTANAGDEYIVGVVSSNPGMIADTIDTCCSKFVYDEWNRPVYEEVAMDEIKDFEGNVVVPARVERRARINPNWNPDCECQNRLDLPDWVPVGLIGKLLVRDDGTCRPGGYCYPNGDGIAAAASQGYRVMKRVSPNIVQILLK